MAKHVDLIGSLALLALLVVAVAAFATGHDADASGPDVPAVRVGTFDTRGVALAYGRSEEFLSYVESLKTERSDAEARGDSERVAELDALGPRLQDELHKQVFGGAPIPDILAMIEDDLPDIAEAAGVDLIVADPLYLAPDAEMIDITRHMAAPFDPDEKTLEILDELLDRPPVDMDTPGDH